MFVEAAGQLTSYSRTEFPSSVSRSADGQILVLTHSFLHILTPGLGLSVGEDRSALSGYPGNKLPDQWSADEKHTDLQPGECSGLTIFKTSIPAQRRSVEWEEFTVDSRLTAAGALDNGWRMTSWSPSGLSDGGWCLLAALTVNCEVFIYGPGSDAVKSVWQEVFDLTAMYMDSLRKDPFLPYHADPSKTADEQKARRDKFTMRTQSTSVAWSRPGPAHAVRDNSVLAVGHRSGHVTFWRWEPSGSMKMLMEQKVFDQWPVLMAWSQWASAMDEPSQIVVLSSMLAVASASGPVQLLRLTLFPDGRIEYNPYQAICESPKAVTVLRWLSHDTLAIGRLADITIWNPKTYRQLDIPVEEFRGWTSISDPIDVVDLPSANTSIIALADGTLRQVSDANSDAPRLHALHEPKSAREGSLALCENLRSSFMILEKVGNKSKNKSALPSTASLRLSGFAQLDCNGTVFLAYEKHQLDRRLYVMPNLRKLNFAIARLNNTELEECVLEASTSALTVGAESGCSESSQKTLFPIMLSLRHLLDRKDYLDRLIEVVKTVVDSENAPVISVHSDIDYISFLLGDCKLQALRLGSLLIQYIHLNAKSDAVRESCQKWLRQMRLAIYSSVFKALDGLLSALAGDTLVKQRYGKVLAALDTAHPVSMDADEEASDVDVFPHELDEAETCAACNEIIPFAQLGKGTCRNGHAWVRCSVTLAIMFTVNARTCTVCSRKSQIPRIGSGSPSDDVVQKALRAAKYCLFCGGRWSRSA